MKKDGLSLLINGQWGFFLIPLIPAAYYLFFLTHSATVDISWIYEARGFRKDQAQDAALIQLMLSKSVWWHAAKQGFWLTTLVACELLLLVIMGVAWAQFFNHPLQTRQLAAGVLLSKAVVFIDLLLGWIHIAGSELPTRILTKDLSLSSWNRLLGLAGDGPIQMYTAFNGPTVFISMAVLTLCALRSGFKPMPAALAWVLLTYGSVHGLLIWFFAKFL